MYDVQTFAHGLLMVKNADSLLLWLYRSHARASQVGNCKPSSALVGFPRKLRFSPTLFNTQIDLSKIFLKRAVKPYKM